MKLIIGLGNPGKRYKNTRHNIGFRVVDRLAEIFNATSLTCKMCRAHLAGVRKGEKEKIFLAKPQTYMNKSGEAVAALANFYKVKPVNIWVIYDDIDLPLGKLRIRTGGGSGGHKGVESIIRQLGTREFVRFRFGIKSSVKSEKLKTKNYRDTTEFVLSPFDKEEEETVKEMIEKVAEAVKVALEKGIEAAMNRYN